MSQTLKFSDLNLSEQILIIRTMILKNESKAVKRKVGAIVGLTINDKIVKYFEGNNYIQPNVNNGSCEDLNGDTVPYTVHAEEEAIFNYLKNHYIQQNIQQNINVTIVVTYSPCQNCSKLIVLSGIKRVLFIEKHSVNFDKIQFSPKDYFESQGVEAIYVVSPSVDEIAEILNHLKLVNDLTKQIIN